MLQGHTGAYSASERLQITTELRYQVLRAGDIASKLMSQVANGDLPRAQRRKAERKLLTTIRTRRGLERSLERMSQ